MQRPAMVTRKAQAITLRPRHALHTRVYPFQPPQVRLERALINQDPPATCADAVVTAVEESAKQFGLPYKRMVSRAYHDSLFMAIFAPTGMIFVPCRGGVSHRPDEFAADKDIEAGTKARGAGPAWLQKRRGAFPLLWCVVDGRGGGGADRLMCSSLSFCAGPCSHSGPPVPFLAVGGATQD